METLAPGAHRARLGAVALLSVAAALAVALLPPIAQPLRYHDFADQRTLLGIPNAWNVATSLGFPIVGALGLRGLWRGGASFGDARRAYALFFLSLVGVGGGSVYYHLDPSHERLFWDRLPMSLAFMSLLACVLIERLGPLGRRLLPWLVAAGPLSVVYWLLSERAGAGDLRPYGFVHFYPVLLIPLLIGLFPPRWTRGGDLLVMLAVYAAALAAERFDREIYAAAGWISGHSVKHLLAALAAAQVLRMLRLRVAAESEDRSSPR